MRLKYQIFVSLLLISALLIALMYAFSNWSFNRGFIGYLNSIDEQVLDSVAQTLVQEYQQDSGWTELQADLERWWSIQRQFSSAARERRRPRNSRQLTTPRRDDRGPPRNPRLIIADADKQVLIGPRRVPAKVLWKTIVVDGEEVGYVGMSVRDSLSNDLDKLFAAQQSRSYAHAALAMVLVSALLAILLSSRIVKPIVRIQRAVSEISGGDFTHRVKASRRDELGELARDVNQLAFTLEENQSERQQWLAEISHELRTPVAVLQGEIESMQDGIKQLDAQAIESLHGETLRLKRLINDLYELSASGVGSLNYRMAELEIEKIVKSRLSASQALLDNKEIKVHYKNSASITRLLGDEQRLEQLFDNLLQNSIRYTDTGGQIRVTMTSDTDNLHIAWEDSSPGVLDEQLPYLFDSLYRTEESRNRETGGSGLGLSIARKIADAHQGEINASHSKLGGLCVNVILPMARVSMT